jgi:TolC family type I secretion outer membrane protein
MVSPTWLALVSVVAAIILSPHSANAIFPWLDPFQSERAVAPAPDVPWEARESLPAVPEPGVPTPVEHVEPLTLAALTEFALRNNPRTREAWLAARAAAAGVGVEQAAWLPDLSAQYGLSQSEQVSTSGTAESRQTRYGPSVSLSYLLFDFGSRGNQVDAAAYNLLVANLTHNRVLQDVVLEVEQAYFRLLGFRALVGANELSLKNTQTALEAAQKRRESGLATVVDVYRVETQVAQAQLALTRSHGELEKAKGQLAAAVGVPVGTPLVVQTEFSPPPVRELTESMADVLTRAKANRPDLIAAEARARAAQSTADAETRSALPWIDLTANTGVTSFTHDRPTVNYYSLSLNLRIPLFTGFRNTYSVRQAREQAEEAAAARDVVSRQTEIDVWQAYYNVQTAASGISSAEAQVKSAEQTAEATLARYQSGHGSILDLITAQEDAATARVDRIQSYFDWVTALAEFNYAVGAGDPSAYQTAAP